MLLSALHLPQHPQHAIAWLGLTGSSSLAGGGISSLLSGLVPQHTGLGSVPACPFQTVSKPRNLLACCCQLTMGATNNATISSAWQAATALT